MLVSNECCMFARSDHLRMRRDLQQSRDRASLEMKISALLFSGLLICSAHTYTGTAPRGPDCGAPGWSVPEPPSGAKLLQVNTIIRHGDRTPWTGQACWPKDTAVWKCYLNSAQIPMYSDTQYGHIIPRIYRKVFNSGGEWLNGNCSVGQLTSIGFNQHQANGASLLESYVKSGFLKNSITSSQIYIRSDNEPRTQQSAEALMLGMYPPVGSVTEVVELHTVDTKYDIINANPTLCPKFGEYEIKFRSSSVWKNHQNVTKAVLDAVSKAVNFTVDEADLNHFADCLITYHCHNLSWPQGMTDQLYDMVWQELSWQFFSMYKYPSVQDNAQVGIGFLLKQIWQNMNKSVQSEPVQRFLLYSGHDTTLMPILVALQVDTMQWPAYASMMLIELYDVTGKFYVRIVYNGQVLKLPFCNSETLCDFSTFSGHMKSVTPSDPALQCQV